MTDPIEVVLLAIDPAKHTSGAAILIPDYGNPLVGENEHPFNGTYVLAEFGKVETQGERNRFVEAFIEAAFELKLPPVVVAEEWDPPVDRRVRLPNGETGIVRDPKWTYPTILGIGEGWGRWSAELESANEYLEGEKYPNLPVVRVKPNEWRDAIFPRPRPKDTQALKETARRYFKGVFGYDVSDDLAEAGCIGLWGTTALAVHGGAEVWKVAQAEQAGAKKGGRKKRA
jgi:hypothetical protein